MAASSKLTVFDYLFSEFDKLLSTYVSETASDIITAISPTAWTLLGIYFVLWGFSMVRGLIDEPLTDGLMRLLKLAIVFGIALNFGRYQTYVVDFMMQTPDAMANVLAFGSDNAEGGGQSTFGMLDTLLNKTIDVANKCYEKMSILSPGQSIFLSIAASAIMFFGLLFTLVAGIMIILAKVSMVVLLALGPIFILLAMFQATQRFFDSWLGQVLNQMLTLIFVLAACTFFFGMVEQAIGNAGAVVEQNPLQAVATIGVVGVAGTFVLFGAASWASSIAGGVALPVGEAAKKLAGGGVIDSAKHRIAHKVVDAALAKATGGGSAAANAVIRAGTSRAGKGFRATNTIRGG